MANFPAIEGDRVISFDEATQILGEWGEGRRAKRIEQEVLLEQAVGHVLSESLKSPIAIPPFDNSAMDGFAVRARETNPKRRILGTIPAGKAVPIDESSEENAAWEIMTGAPLPKGFDAVIRVEETSLQSGPEKVVALARSPYEGENIRRSGEDFRVGDGVVTAGTVLMPHHILALATLGWSGVKVWKKPSIALLSTGRELVEPSLKRPLAPGEIYNSTQSFLLSALPLMGAVARTYGIVSDEPIEFSRVIGRILKDKPDLIVTTGAVSMGKYDFIATALGELGARTLFHKVAIRPGKPLLVAEFPDEGSAFFGLPGNPISTAVGLRFFIEPFLRSWLGRPPERPSFLYLDNTFSKPKGILAFCKARLSPRIGTATILNKQPSFMVSPLNETNGWVVLPEEDSVFEAGRAVATFPLYALSSDL